MIGKLTAEQETKIAEYRDKYFRQAVSTEPADRPRAEAAAKRMGEIAGGKIGTVHWVDNPRDGDSLSKPAPDPLPLPCPHPEWGGVWDYDILWADLSDILWAILSDSLSDRIRARRKVCRAGSGPRYI